MKRLANLRPVALAALGVFLGRGAQADTTVDFNAYDYTPFTQADMPAGQTNYVQIVQTFGDYAAASIAGVTVTGFGTPNIGLTWQATGGRWDYYNDTGVYDVWSAGQLDSSNVGDTHEIVFTPNVSAASAVVKSFNFHPYYVSSERYTYNVSVLAGATVVSGPTTYTFLSDATKNHPVSINYNGSLGQTLTLRLARVASTLAGGETEGSPGNIAVDDITFAQLPETEFAAGPEILSVSLANGQTSVPPDYLYSATITNKATFVVTNTIQLKHSFAGVVSPNIISNSGLTTISYASAGPLIPGGSTNKFTLTFDDNGLPVKHYTNEVQYVVADYVDIKLPTAIVLENFNSTTEGNLPGGWTATNLDGVRNPTSEPNITFTNLDSAVYSNWTVVEASRFTGTFDTYSQLYKGLVQPAGYAADYQRVLTLNPSNVVNGAFIRNLATGRMAFGNSGYRNDALGQIVYMFSPDFNLTGQTNVYLSFHSLWEQNHDSIASVEYSTDSGTTWQPIVYMLQGFADGQGPSDVLTNLDGSIDSLKTFTNVWADVARYVDTGVTNGGFYGAFIGVAPAQWPTLAPYISRRVNDNPLESKRVEIFRLPQADNKPNVRLRFAHAGTDAWYFGVDDVGLYSLPPFKITSIIISGGNVSISWNGAAGTKLQKSTSLTSPNWQDVPGSNGASNALDPVAGGPAYYRLVRPY